MNKLAQKEYKDFCEWLERSNQQPEDNYNITNQYRVELEHSGKYGLYEVCYDSFDFLDAYSKAGIRKVTKPLFASATEFQDEESN